MNLLLAVIVLLGSGFLLAFGLYIVISLAALDPGGLDVFIMAEILGLPDWRLHFYLGGAQNIVLGLAGVVAGIALARKYGWGRRLWLGLVAWEMLLVLVPSGDYGFQQPDPYTIAATWAVGIFSFAVLLNKKLSAFYHKPGKGLYLPVLAFVVVSNLVLLLVPQFVKPAEQEPVRFADGEGEGDEVEAVLKSAFMKKAMTDLYGECALDFYQLFSLSEKKDADALIVKAEAMRKNGYADDRAVLMYLGEAYYAKGDRQKAAEMFRGAIAGTHHCKFTRPEGRMAVMDLASLHYALFLLLEELGDGAGAEAERLEVEKALKEFHGAAYTEEKLATFMKNFKFALIDYNEINNKNKRILPSYR
ncbi:MAG: hypothetical protein AB1921_19430 [Thermodesulfobacteriota bacterium]